MVEIIGLIAGILLPLWNIPLILRMEKRKSSKDISLYWVFGVWVCLVFMFPSAFFSKDIVYKTYSMINILFFTLVMIQTVRYREK